MKRRFIAAFLGALVLACASSVWASDFINLSTRGYVGTGDGVLIGGLIIDQTGPKRLLIRGRGPSLPAAAVPVDEQLHDPFLQIAGGEGNDNWADHPLAVKTTGPSAA